MFPNQLIITKTIRYVFSTLPSRYVGEKIEEEEAAKQRRWQNVCWAVILAAIYHDTTKTCEFEYIGLANGVWLSWGLKIFPPRQSNTIAWHNKMRANVNIYIVQFIRFGLQPHTRILASRHYTCMRLLRIFHADWHYWFYLHYLFTLIFFV